MTNDKISKDRNSPKKVVGVGASAGGLDAIRKFFSNLDNDTDMAYVVIQHLSPDFKSLMDELLSRHTIMDIVRVDRRVKVKKNTIYLIPPKKNMYIEDGFLYVKNFESEKVFQLPINEFFKSLAVDFKERAIGIVLSGTGSDGSSGIVEIHNYGGFVMVQDEESAAFDGMPKNAKATNVADLILKPEEMARIISEYIKYDKSIPELKLTMDKKNFPGEFGKIIMYIYRKYNIDFNKYKISTVYRRITRRMQFKNIKDIDEYLNLLDENEEESSALYKDLLIGVTCFFRDNKVFDKIEEVVIPKIVNEKKPGEDIRVWVPSSSTGEEAYSIAILFEEYFLKTDKFINYKIFATDVNKTFTDFASEGIYTLESMEQMPKKYKDKYFSETELGRFKISKMLRNRMVFAFQNLLTDPPFTKVDLISCRNFLIYIDNEFQKKIFSSFHFGLNRNGILVLGASESLGDSAIGFETIDRHCKIYKKKELKNFHLENNSFKYNPIRAIASNNNRTPVDYSYSLNSETQDMKIYSSLMDAHMPSSILINDKYQSIYFFGDVKKYLKPSLLGKASLDILKMVPDNIKIILSAAIQKAMKKKDCINYDNIFFDHNGIKEVLNISVEPVLVRGVSKNLYFIKFTEKTERKINNRNKESTVDISKESQERILYLEGELQYTKEALQTTVEELETSNEELQASNEELQASNEELQSTNEELHSVNEELYTVNAEHEQKIEQLTKMTNDLNNLMNATNIGVLFLDDELRIRKFTTKAAEIFNLMEIDLGRPLTHITDIFSDEVDFIELAKESIRENKVIIQELNTLADTTYLISVMPYITESKEIDGIIITFVDITSNKKTQNEIQQKDIQFREFFSFLHEGAAICEIITDEKNQPIDFKFLEANPEMHKAFKQQPGNFINKTIKEIFPDIEDYWIKLLGKVALSGKPSKTIAKSRIIDGKEKWYRQFSYCNKPGQFIICIQEITDEIEERENLSESEKFFRELFKNSKVGIFCCEGSGNSIFINNYLLDLMGLKYEKSFSIDSFIFEIDGNQLKFEDILDILPKDNIKTKIFINKNDKNNKFILCKTSFSVREIDGVDIYEATIVDETENFNKMEKLEYIAQHDRMTTLLNRDSFNEHLEKSDLSFPFGIIVIDFDGLKLTNDAFGHEEGDKSIIYLAKTLKEVFSTDFVSRTGGDEFAVFIEKASEETITMKMNRVITKLKKIKTKIPINISYGYSLSNGKEESPKEIYKIAEDNMYEVKFSKKADGRMGMLEYLKKISNERTNEDLDHCKKVENLSVEIANKMQLSRRSDIEDLRKMAYYHDIGKIAVNSEILNKKEPLTEEEWKIIKNHTLYGYRIVSSIPALFKAADGILSHHERWDGKGYPNRIKGKELSILVRIISVADAYVAMKSDRPYRKALTDQKAIKEIIDGKGTQFDPEVVEAFLELVKSK